MTQTKLPPEVEKWLDDHPAPRTTEAGKKLEDSQRDPPSADRRARPSSRRRWAGVDWLILFAIVGCLALLLKLVAEA